MPQCLLFDAIPAPIWVFDRETLVILAVNSAGISHYGYSPEECLGMTLQDIHDTEDIPALLKYLDSLDAHPVSLGIHPIDSWKHRKRDGVLISVEITCATMPLGGRSVGLMLIHDITSRRRIDEAMRQSESHVRAIFNGALDAVIGIDEMGRITDWNPQAEAILGYSRDEAIGQDVATIIPSRYRMTHAHGLNNFLMSGEDTFLHRRIEVTALRRDGTEFPIELSIIPLKIGSSRRFTAFMADITARKEAQRKLEQSYQQLRTLSHRLEAIREDERTRIARQVHDELGMALTCLKLDLSWMSKLATSDGMTLSGALLNRLRSMTNLVDNTIRVVQEIASDLRPGVLDELGLVAALEWQARDFQVRTDVACIIDSKVESLHPDRERDTALFRICQEALTNVARHARATRVVIRLAIVSGTLNLSIKDNGLGIQLDKISAPHSLGVMGMRERAELLGGVLHITGISGQGSTITVQMPLAILPEAAHPKVGRMDINTTSIAGRENAC